MSEGQVEPVQPNDPVAAALRMRASDADREKVAGVLRDAFADGRLSHAEHDERLTATYQATTYAKLVPLLSDLPGATGALAIPAVNQAISLTRSPFPATTPGAGLVVDPSLAPQAIGHSVAVMSGVERRGRWVVPESSNAIAIMGGVVFDFSEAILTAPVTEITVVALMGGVDVTVPEGVEVRINVFGFMGGSTGPTDVAPPGAPVIVFKGVAIMGGLSVDRPRGTRKRSVGS